MVDYFCIHFVLICFPFAYFVIMKFELDFLQVIQYITLIVLFIYDERSLTRWTVHIGRSKWNSINAGGINILNLLHCIYRIIENIICSPEQSINYNEDT